MDCTPEHKKTAASRDTTTTWAGIPDIIEMVLSFCDVLDGVKTARVSKACAETVKALPDSYFHYRANKIVKEDGNAMFQALHPILQHVRGRTWKEWLQGASLERCRVKGCSHITYKHAQQHVPGVNFAHLITPARTLLKLPVVCNPCCAQLMFWVPRCQATNALIETLKDAKLNYLATDTVNIMNMPFTAHFVFIRAEAEAVLMADKSWPRDLRDIYNLHH